MKKFRALETIKKFIIRYLIPIGYQEFIHKLKSKNRKNKIVLDVKSFDLPEYALFREELGKAERYAEYGVGASTIYIAKNFTCEIRAVESDREFAKIIADQVQGRATILCPDLGPTKEWGYLNSYSHRENYSDYFFSIFSDYNPDLIYIDGRFRVACFFASLLKGAPGTAIIFDDFPHRFEYHIVLEILKPVKISERAALFEIPNDLDKDSIKRLLDKFEYVMQ